VPKTSDERAHAAKSVPTGLYWPCSTPGIHPGGKMFASEVQRGPKNFWVECSSCGTRQLLAPKKVKTTDKSTPNFGWTEQQCLGQGFELI
jgi:hypothetical protein